MGLRSFETRLERLVEGVFARVFRSGVQPIEIGRRLARAFDRERSLDVQGRTVGPNHFVVRLSPGDHERLGQMGDTLDAELRAGIRAHAASNGVRFVGPVAVEREEDVEFAEGVFRVEASFAERVGGVVASLDLPDGSTLPLEAGVVTIGRLPESTVVLADQNASRRHAELHPAGDSFELVDLGSTNGCKVNGEPVSRRFLEDGDQLTFGAVTMRFRLS